MPRTSRPPRPRRLLGATGADELIVLWRSRAGRALVLSVGAILVATLAGLAVLWPAARTEAPDVPPSLAALVTEVRDAPCPGGAGDGGQQCRTIRVDPNGALPPADIELGPADGGLRLTAGDRVRVTEVPDTELLGANAEARPYALGGVDHQRSLGTLAGLLAILAFIALRIRGVLAIAGVGLSLFLLSGFLVPATLDGHPPIFVALVGALAVMFVTLVLTNGIGAQTLAGALGIAATLVLTTLLGLAAVRWTGLDGTGSEFSIVLAQAQPGLSLEGVLLAGMVVGGLGVLADTAVTQASAVMALRRTDPGLSARRLYVAAVGVGRDHLSATIHTLVLAYAGATLPLLLVLHAGGVSPVDTLNQTDIAEPILATVIGCAGLIAAVPLTTGLAAFFVHRIPARALPDHGHGHHH